MVLVYRDRVFLERTSPAPRSAFEARARPSTGGLPQLRTFVIFFSNGFERFYSSAEKPGVRPRVWHEEQRGPGRGLCRA